MRIENVIWTVASHSVDVAEGTTRLVTFAVLTGPCPLLFFHAFHRIIFVELLLYGGGTESLGRSTSTATAYGTVVQKDHLNLRLFGF